PRGPGPPPPVRRDAALERLRASGQHMSKAIASLTPERGRGYTVTLPFGTLSLYELADFGAAHVTRHCGQLERAVGKIGERLWRAPCIRSPPVAPMHRPNRRLLAAGAVFLALAAARCTS